MDLDLRQLAQIARRRAWLAVLLMVVAATAAYVSSSRETPVYAAKATMLVTPGQGTATADLGALQATRSLAETYRLMIETGPLLDRVIETLDLPLDADELDDMVSTAIVGETQLISVTVTGTDPEQIAQIANTTVDEFKHYVEELARNRSETTRSALDSQIEELENRREEIESRIAELTGAEDSQSLANQQELSRLAQEQVSVNASLQTLNTTALTLDTEQIARSALVEPLDPATVPETPVSPQVRRSALLGAFVGLLLAVGFAALLEYLDNSVKPDMDMQAITDAPVLAAIDSLPKLQPGPNQVFTLARPHAMPTEATRMLRTNLEFAAASEPIATLTVTSPGPGEGKSTIVANLGVVMAQAGIDTVILDADLRRPTQHRIFGVKNTSGVTTLLTNPSADWEDVASRVALPGLRLISSGPLPPNPADLLGSDRFQQLLAHISADVDLVVIDTSPLLAVSDPMSVAAHTDGVILVATSHQTRVDGLRHAAETVQQAGIRLVGIVMNRTRRQAGAGYYYEYYGSNDPPRGNWRNRGSVKPLQPPAINKSNAS